MPPSGTRPSVTRPSGTRRFESAAIPSTLLAAVILAVGAVIVAPTGLRAQAPEVGICLEPEQAAPVGSPAPESGARVEAMQFVPTASGSYGLAIDADDPYGRVYVASRQAPVLAVLYGRGKQVQVACRLEVGATPNGVAIDPSTGRVLITLSGSTGVAVIEGRSERPRLAGVIELGEIPTLVAIDGRTRRAFVSLSQSGEVMILEPDGDSWRPGARFPVGPWPGWLAVDDSTGRLVVSNWGQSFDQSADLHQGSVAVFDARRPVPERLGEPIAASQPAGIAFDPRSGKAYIAEQGDDQLLILDLTPDPAAPTVSRMPVDPMPDPGLALNPIGVALLPAARELAVALDIFVPGVTEGRLDILQLDDDGVPTFERAEPAPLHSTGIALDTVTGRAFVADFQGGVGVTQLDVPSQAVAPPIAEALPGPLDISLAPEDLARSLGITLFAMLLVAGPTPIFNSTLEQNVEVIHGWLARLRRRLGLARPGTGGREEPTRLGAGLAMVARVASVIARGPLGVVAYLGAAALIYAFLDPGFPGDDGPLVLGVALVSLAVATALAALPGRSYLRRHPGAPGGIRVVPWTLLIAIGCVMVTRLVAVEPGYVYGIIGVFVVGAALSVADEGRLAARGAVLLLAMALLVWFLRIPFEPEPGLPPSPLVAAVNAVLVTLFVVGVEGVVFGLLPLAFMPGQALWRWSRWRWALLWAAGVGLFAHVIVHPVTDYRPAPRPASLITVVITVSVYGAVALGTWAFFRRRAARAGSAPPPSAQDAPVVG